MEDPPNLEQWKIDEQMSIYLSQMPAITGDMIFESSGTPCNSNSDCPSGEICGEASNFGSGPNPDQRYCVFNY